MDTETAERFGRRILDYLWRTRRKDILEAQENFEADGMKVDILRGRIQLTRWYSANKGIRVTLEPQRVLRIEVGERRDKSLIPTAILQEHVEEVFLQFLRGEEEPI